MTRKDDVWDIIKSFLGSMVGGTLLALLVSLGIARALFTTYYDLDRTVVLYLIIGALILVITVFILSIKYSLVPYSHMYTRNGREDAMKANLKLLKIRKPRDQAEWYILSTRMSHWPQTESSPTRTEFRKILTEKIESGIVAKRIWQIWNGDDVRSLEHYLDKYKDYDNLSIKFFVGDFPLPEILISYGKGASVSMPQPNDPKKLTTTFHFYGKKEIQRWKGYYDVLWDIAAPAKIGSKIYYQEIKKLRDEFRETSNS